MIKNSQYTGTVFAIGSDCEGVIYADGTTAFVPFCLEGEEVEFLALKVKGGIAYGKLSRVLRPSPARVSPPCPVFGKCGGCNLQHACYAEQLKIKRGLVENALKKIAGVSFPVDACVPCEKEYRYRNKLVMPISRGNFGAFLGFFARASHRAIPVDDCPIQSEWVKDVIYSVKKFAKLKNLTGYSDEEGGDLRHITVREINGKFIFAVVATRKLDLSPLAEILDGKFENFTLLLNVNPAKTNAIFSNEWHICRGDGVFEAEDCGIKFLAGANTFLQVNDGVRRKLYARILQEAEEDAVALDLYSGGGMLTAMLAKKCRKAYGVEAVVEASRCADGLKRLNGLDNMYNICGRVEDEISRVLSGADGKKFVVCDPPRKGMERSAAEAVARSGAEKVALVSCNPATLARDLGILTGALKEKDGKLVKSPEASGAYKLVSVTPFDMFPQTKHVEAVAVLVLNK